MQHLRHFSRLMVIPGLLIMLSILAACKNNTPTAEPPTAAPAATTTVFSAGSTLTPSLPAPTPSPAPTPTLAKTAALLIISGQTDPALASIVKGLMQDLAEASGLELHIQASLGAKDLKPGIKAVVVLPPDPGLARAAADAPQVQFAAVGLSGIQPAANLSVINAGSSLSQQAFLAGYIAAILTPDWRTGVLGLGGDTAQEKAAQAFLNGVRFFCGLCKPAYPPFVNYPLSSLAAALQDWKPAADVLLAQSVKTIYIVPGAAGPEAFAYLSKSKIQLLGGENPAEGIQANWIATISPDFASALKKVWSGLMAGQGGQQISVGLALTNINPQALPEARLRIIQETLTGLGNGRILPDQVAEP